MGRTVPNRAAAYSLTPRATYSARTFGGSTWQALKDTAQTPGGNDWQLVARGGSDAFMPKILGNYSAEKDYRCLDIVALDGSSFIACCDFPGKCPGKEWQLLAGVGPPGPQDPQGEKGESVVGPPGKLPIVKPWRAEAVFYQGDVLPSGDRGKPARRQQRNREWIRRQKFFICSHRFSVLILFLASRSDRSRPSDGSVQPKLRSETAHSLPLLAQRLNCSRCKGDVMAYYADSLVQLQHDLRRQLRGDIASIRATRNEVLPEIEMVIGSWYVDEFGNRTREIKARERRGAKRQLRRE